MDLAFHAPGLRAGAERSVVFGKRVLGVRDLSKDEIRALVTELRERAPRSRHGIEARARALAQAAHRFLDRGDALRRQASAALPEITGFSPAMIEESLSRAFAPLTESAIAAIAARTSEAVVPLLGIVSAGNIPGVALAQTVLALAAGASCIVKTASGEPLLSVLFARAVGEIAPELGASLAVLWWRGGEASHERELARGVDSLVVYGAGEAIAAWSGYAPRRMIGHGHRASIAVVRLEEESIHPESRGSLAERAALDVALYDQLGCLSPQCLFVIGADPSRRRSFVEHLGMALDDLERRLPRGVVPESSALAIRRLRDEHEWREIAAGAVSAIHGGDPSRWMIIDDPTPEFRASPLYRTLLVHSVERAEDLPPALGRWLPRIESAGIGPWPDPEISRVLAGIPRLVPLGSMQSPDLGWRQGGIDPMAAIVEGGGA